MPDVMLGLVPFIIPSLVVAAPLPAEVQQLLERRRRLGLDHKDEVWEGVLHVVPAPEVRHARISQQLAVILDAPARAADPCPQWQSSTSATAQTTSGFQTAASCSLTPPGPGCPLHR